MGTNRSYAILPADRPRPVDSTRLSAVAGWSQWELPVLETDELAALAGDGPAVLATVVMSDFCDVAGHAGGEVRGHGYWAVPPTGESPDRIASASWVLLLGRRHLDQLGGPDALRAAYEFASVEPVGELWRFQATEDPRDFDRASRERLHAVLAPILAPPRP